MAFLDSYFRSASQAAVASERKLAGAYHRAAMKPGAFVAPSFKAVKAGGSMLYKWSFVIHKWAGLFAAGWLAVLGLTGFFLNNSSWRWEWQSKVPSWLSTRALEQSANKSVARLLQIDPDDNSKRVAGGTRGLWFSQDAGQSWQSTALPDGDHPQTFAIEPDPALGWKWLWFATDDGVYASDDNGASAYPAALRGEFVTALAAGSSDDEMIGVIDKSEVFRFKTNDPARITRLNLAPPSVESRPDQVQVSRFVLDLHFGKGVFNPLSSSIMNDIGGLGMFILSVTGLLYWGLPKYWKHQAKARVQSLARDKVQTKSSKTTKELTILWLFRLHSVTIGIASVLMLMYLAVTGILIGHYKELGDWMKATRIPQSYLTPVFGMPSWKGWIDSIVAYPDKQDALTVGSRIGLFTTVDGGQNWVREESSDGKPFDSVYRLRRLGKKVLIPNGMAGPSVIRGDDLVDREVTGGAPMSSVDHSAHVGMMHEMSQGATAGGDGAGGAVAGKEKKREVPDPATASMAGMFMPSDVTRMGDKLAWKNSDKLFITDADGKQIEKLDFKQPDDPGTPWFYWLLRVHMGTIFWSEWKWVNDVFAIAAVFLSVTGLIRWWRKKWA